jgi:signal peptide peptidase SppA
MTMHKYQPRAPLLAIDPKAFFGLFSSYEEPENDQRDDVTIVTIRGPLSQHDDWWEDSYEAILGRVEEACQQAAPVVVLRIDSPGGVMAGLFDTARAIRTACDNAEKQLLAHVEGQCCSAAYALATAADRIVASRTAEVGSIGVIAARLDETKALENIGYKITLVTSGARKADGYPCRPMSDEEQAEFQADIDGLAAEFFDVVSLRRGIPTDQIAAFEAASFRGSAAVKAGLVDELGSFDHLIASLGSETAGVTTMSEEEKKARDALRAIAEDEECSDEDREKARKAIAVLDGENDEPEDDEDEGAEDEDESAEDEDNDEDAEDDDDDKEAKASRYPGTVSASTAAELASHGSKLERRVAKLERLDEAKERKRLIESHGGVTKGMAKILGTKPVKEVKALLTELPKPKKPKLGDHAATTTVPGTRGADQGKAAQLPPDEAKAMRQAMGMESENFGIVDQGNVTMLGAPTAEGGES